MSIKIVIVDDDEQDAKITNSLLVKNGYPEAQVFESGAAALEKLEEIQPDLIILDVMLPVEDGFEVCEKMRELLGLDVKIILLTGVMEKIDVGKARKVGANNFAVKTSDGKFLIEIVDEMYG